MIKGENLDEETIHSYYEGITTKVPNNNGYVSQRNRNAVDAELNDIQEQFWEKKFKNALMFNTLVLLYVSFLRNQSFSLPLSTKLNVYST